MISSERMNGIRAFVQAELSGSFSQAAAQLGLSQSAVGKAIARLESRLGVRLFHRTTRSLSLTDEGRSYYQSCVRALAELEAAEGMIADRKGAPSGCLRVNLPDLFGRRWIMPILLDLARRYPALTLEVSFDNRFVDLAEEGFDLVVRIGELRDSADLIARQLGVQKLMMCGAPGYFRQHGVPDAYADLGNHSCIAQIRHGRQEPWLLLDSGARVQRVTVASRHRFGTLDAIADAAVAELGIAQLPIWLVHDQLQSGKLVPLFPHPRQPHLPIHAVWLHSKVMTPRVRAAVDALAEHFGPGTEWDRL